MSSSLFRNESALSSDFLPAKLPFRETQIEQLAGNLKTASERRRGQNTFIFGSPGIGKTATVKYVFRELEEAYPNVKTVYINCWDYKTSIAVMSKVTTDLGMFVARRGLGKDEVNQKFNEALAKSKKNVVICLDEADQLINKEPGGLYNLVRSNESSGKDVTLVLISNNPDILSKLEYRVMSSLNAEEVEFKSYKIDEMKSILTERAKLAFGYFEKAAVLLAANHAVQNNGDVRIGLQCLEKSARLAEKKGDGSLKVSHVRDVVKDVKSPRPQILKKKIGDNEKAILGVVNRSKSLSFTELYERYSKKVENPVSVRMVQDYVKHLSEAKMIRMSEKKVGGKRMIYRSEL